jgi:hypothetical protein
MADIQEQIKQLRIEQEATKGATDWFRLEEEIQALLEEENG